MGQRYYDEIADRKQYHTWAHLKYEQFYKLNQKSSEASRIDWKRGSKYASKPSGREKGYYETKLWRYFKTKNSKQSARSGFFPYFAF